jgi:hypothetical protein
MSLININLNSYLQQRQQMYSQIINADNRKIPQTHLYQTLQQEWLNCLNQIDIYKLSSAGWNIKEDFVGNNQVVPKVYTPSIEIDDSQTGLKVEEPLELQFGFFNDGFFTNDKVFLYDRSNTANATQLRSSTDYFQENNVIQTFSITSSILQNSIYQEQLGGDTFGVIQSVQNFVASIYSNKLIEYQNKIYTLSIFNAYVRDRRNYFVRCGVHLSTDISNTTSSVINLNNNGRCYYIDINTSDYSHVYINIQSVLQQNNLLNIYFIIEYDNSSKYYFTVLQIDLNNLQESSKNIVHEATANSNTDWSSKKLQKLVYVAPHTPELQNQATITPYFLSYTTSNDTSTVNSIYYYVGSQALSGLNKTDFSPSLSIKYLKTLSINKKLYLYGQNSSGTSYYITFLADVTANSYSLLPKETGTNSCVCDIIPYQNDILCSIYSEDNIFGSNYQTDDNRFLIVRLNATTLEQKVLNVTSGNTMFLRTGSQFTYIASTPLDIPTESCFFADNSGVNIFLGWPKGRTHEYYTLSHIINSENAIQETINDPLAYAYIDLQHTSGKEMRFGFCYNLPSLDTVCNYNNKSLNFNHCFVSYSDKELGDIREEVASGVCYSTTTQTSDISAVKVENGLFAYETAQWEVNDGNTGNAYFPNLRYVLSLDSNGEYGSLMVQDLNQNNLIGLITFGNILEDKTRAFLNWTLPVPNSPIPDANSFYKLNIVPDNGSPTALSAYWSTAAWLYNPDTPVLYIVDLIINNTKVPCSGLFSVINNIGNSVNGTICLRPARIYNTADLATYISNSNRLLFPIQIAVSSDSTFIKNNKTDGVLGTINTEYATFIYKVANDPRQDVTGHLLENGNKIILNGQVCIKWNPEFSKQDNPFSGV